MKRALSTPAIENITETLIISAFGSFWVGAPARKRDVGVARAVDDPLRQDRLAAGLALGDDATDLAAFHDGRDERPVQHRDDARLLDEHVGDVLEPLGVERVAGGLRLRRRCAHRRRARLQLGPDALDVDGLRMPVPGEALDPDLGDIAAKAAVALQQRRLHPRPRRRQSRRQSGGTGAHHEHVGFVDDWGLPGRLVDRSRHAGPRLQRHHTATFVTTRRRGVPSPLAGEGVGRSLTDEG